MIERISVLIAGLMIAAGAMAAEPSPRPFGAATAASVSRDCDRVAEGRIDRTVFAGAAHEGSAEEALAIFWKWFQLGQLDFVGKRADIERVIENSGSIRICVLFDALGYPVAEWWDGPQSRKFSWWVAGRAGPSHCIEDHSVQYSYSETRHHRWCAIPTMHGFHIVQSRPGGDLSRRVGTVSRDDGLLTLRMFWFGVHNETVTIDDLGLPVEQHARSCYSPEDPCDSPWELTRFHHDARGNLIGRTHLRDGAEIERPMILELNPRGDWSAWHFEGFDAPEQISRRTIIYRD